MSKNKYKFFTHRKCEYFPCHSGVDKFNCLFCYCPLYNLDCDGTYRHIFVSLLEKGPKDCSLCTLPHTDYEAILNKLRELASNQKTITSN